MERVELGADDDDQRVLCQLLGEVVGVERGFAGVGVAAETSRTGWRLPPWGAKRASIPDLGTQPAPDSANPRSALERYSDASRHWVCSGASIETASQLGTSTQPVQALEAAM